MIKGRYAPSNPSHFFSLDNSSSSFSSSSSPSLFSFSPNQEMEKYLLRVFLDFFMIGFVFEFYSCFFIFCPFSFFLVSFIFIFQLISSSFKTEIFQSISQSKSTLSQSQVFFISSSNFSFSFSFFLFFSQPIIIVGIRYSQVPVIDGFRFLYKKGGEKRMEKGIIFLLILTNKTKTNKTAKPSCSEQFKNQNYPLHEPILNVFPAESFFFLSPFFLILSFPSLPSSPFFPYPC